MLSLRTVSVSQNPHAIPFLGQRLKMESVFVHSPTSACFVSSASQETVKPSKTTKVSNISTVTSLIVSFTATATACTPNKASAFAMICIKASGAINVEMLRLRTLTAQVTIKLNLPLPSHFTVLKKAAKLS